MYQNKKLDRTLQAILIIIVAVVSMIGFLAIFKINVAFSLILFILVMVCLLVKLIDMYICYNHRDHKLDEQEKKVDFSFTVPVEYQEYGDFTKKVILLGKRYDLDIQIRNAITKHITYYVKSKDGEKSHDISVYFEDSKTISVINGPRSITSSDTLNLLFIITQVIYQEQIKLINGSNDILKFYFNKEKH